MLKKIFFISLITYFTTPAHSDVKSKPYWFQWYISQKVSRDDVIKPNLGYQLFNAGYKQVLYYKERRWGINLSFNDSGNVSENITFKDQNNDGRLETGENVAIHVEGGGYLKYEYRSKGISLVWSTAPVYEWQILEDNKAILDVKINKRYGLYNHKVNNFLVYSKMKGDVVYLDWQPEY
jgi:hypothetical protein